MSIVTNPQEVLDQPLPLDQPAPIAEEPIVIETEQPQPSQPEPHKENIGGGVVRGSLWVLGSSVASRGLGIVRMILLARLLTPDDFGIFGMVLVASGLISTVTALGTFDALVQRKHVTDDYLNTAWTLEMARSVVIAAALALTAPLLGLFFNSDRVVPLIVVYSLVIVINGASNMSMVHLVKQLKLHKQIITNLSGTLTSITVSIVLAFLLKSVWALVIGEISGATARCIVSYLMQPYRPRLDFNRTRMAELFRFSRWLTLNAAMNFGITMGDNAIVGRLLGPASLGIYQFSFNLSSAVGPDLVSLLAQSTFPAYSLIQDEPARLRAAFLRSLRISMLFISPVCLGVGALAPIFVPTVLGARWLDTIPILHMLAVYGIVRAFSSATSPLFVALGKPKYVSMGLITNLIAILVFTLPITIIWGTIGTAVSVTLASLLFSGTYGVVLVRNVGIPLLDLLKILLISLAPAVIMAVVVLSVIPFLPVDLIGIIGAIVIGAATYLAVATIADRSLLFSVFHLVRHSILGR